MFKHAIAWEDSKCHNTKKNRSELLTMELNCGGFAVDATAEEKNALTYRFQWVEIAKQTELRNATETLNQMVFFIVRVMCVFAHGLFFARFFPFFPISHFFFAFIFAQTKKTEMQPRCSIKSISSSIINNNNKTKVL